MANENELVIRINGNAKNFLDEVDKIKKQTESLEKVLTATAKASAVAFAGFAGSIALVTKSFVDYEKALVGVGKTTGIEGKKLADFGKQFQSLSSEIPLATNELLGIAQVAGQLGVQGEENILKFTDTIAKLGVATDVTGEQAATSITRILNVTGESISTVDSFGSVLVRLGNNAAATESEILRVTNEVARATAQFKIGSTNALAISTALKELGQQAQLGGSVVGKTFRQIDAAIRGGGQSLRNLEQVTGLTGEQLRETFERDATEVFTAFIKGLGEARNTTLGLTGTLEQFGLQGDEVNKVIPALVENVDKYEKAFALANDEVQKGTALNEEARTAFDTLGSDLQILNNTFTNASTNIGEALAPAIRELVQATNGLLQEIADLDKETIESIANFLKWGAIITGALASVTAFLAGLLKVRAILGGLRVAFNVGRIAAIGFTGALTGGLSLVLGFLPEIITGVKALVGSFKNQKPETLIATNKELDEINEKIKEIEENRGGASSTDLVNLRALKEQREELQKLREEQLRASEDFGTGKLLVRPTQTEGIDLDLPQEQAIPLRPETEGEDPNEKLKKDAEKRQEILNKATAQRIEKAKAENEALLNIFRQTADAQTEEEAGFLRRRAEIENEFNEARKIENAQEREIALENLQLKHAQELAEIDEFEEQKKEDRARRKEEEDALNEELRELSNEQRAQFDEEDRQALQAKIDTQREAEKKASTERLNRQIQERNQFKQDEIKFGTEVANLKKFFNKEEVQGFKNTSQQLAQLSQSRNSTLKGIGKAAARVNAAIKTAEGAIAAYTSLAGIPIIGPALGAAAAAALIAFGVEQQSKISSAQTGGFVPPTSVGGGARDRVPTLLEPNELVVPAPIAPNFIQAAGIPDTQTDQAVGDVTDSGTPVIEIMLQDRAGEVISLEQREGKSLGLIGDE